MHALLWMQRHQNCFFFWAHRIWRHFLHFTVIILIYEHKCRFLDGDIVIWIVQKLEFKKTFFSPWTILNRDLKKIFPFLWAPSQENIFHELVYSADCLCVLLRSKLRCWRNILAVFLLFYFTFLLIIFSNVIPTHDIQFSSVAHSCLTLCNPMDFSTPVFPLHHRFPELTQTHVHLVSDAIQWSHTLSSPLRLPSIFPSIRVLNESVLHIKWPKYWSLSFSIRPSN